MKTRKLLIFVLLSFLTGCSTLLFPAMPSIGVPIEKLNKDVNITAPVGWNSFRLNDNVILDIKITGTEQVVFPPDYGVKLFMLSQGDWIEVNNVPTEYTSEEIILFPSKGDPFGSGVLPLFPLLPDTDNSTLLRIFVIGHTYKNNTKTDELVGGYIDINLES